MSVRTMRANRVWMFSLFFGVATSGCAAIVGADGYSVGDGGSGGTGGSTGGAGGGADGGKSDAATGGTGGATGGTGGGKGGSAGTGGATGGTGGATGGTGGATGGTGGATGGTGGATGGTGGATGGTGGATGGTGGTSPPPDGGPPPTGLGETICNTGGAACPAGQVCQGTGFSPPGLCTQMCQTAATCGAGHDCVGSMEPADMFPFVCVKQCSGSVACPTNFLCVSLSSGGAVCLPTGWLDELGVGDDCVVDEQCVSGTCRNKPNGWCSKPCGPADSLCAHSASQFENRNGELNWCVSNGGAQTCVPGCDLNNNTTCALYPGTTCRIVTDIGGTMQRACLP